MAVFCKAQKTVFQCAQLRGRLQQESAMVSGVCRGLHLRGANPLPCPLHSSHAWNT